MQNLPVEVVVFDLLVVLEDPAAINEPLQVSLNVHLRGNLLLQVFNGALVVHVFYGVIGRVQGLDRHLDGGHDLNVSNVFGKLLTFSNRVDSFTFFTFVPAKVPAREMNNTFRGTIHYIANVLTLTIPSLTLPFGGNSKKGAIKIFTSAR